MALVHPRMADIEAAVATACGDGLKEVAITARRLRESDLLTRETRSPRSWRSTPLDAARIAAGLMTGVGPIHAPAAVKAMEAVKLEPERVIEVRNGLLDFPQPLRSGILRRPNIVGAIEAMITHVASAHDRPYGALAEFSSVTYNFRENTGEAWLRWVTENVLGPKEAHLFYFGPSRRDVGLSARYTLKFSAICQIAQLFRE